MAAVYITAMRRICGERLLEDFQKLYQIMRTEFLVEAGIGEKSCDSAFPTGLASVGIHCHYSDCKEDTDEHTHRHDHSCRCSSIKVKPFF